MTLRELSCKLAGVEYSTARRLPTEAVTALKDYTGLSHTSARLLLCGVNKPSQQLLNFLKERGHVITES